MKTKSFALLGFLALLPACDLEPPMPPAQTTTETEQQEVVVRDSIGVPQLVFHFQQVRAETPGLPDDVTTTLSVENVSGQTMSFQYDLEVWSSFGYYQWGTTGFVHALPDGAESDEGIVSEAPFDLRFGRIAIRAY
jgi:hypothetical protein